MINLDHHEMFSVFPSIHAVCTVPCYVTRLIIHFVCKCVFFWREGLFLYCNLQSPVCIAMWDKYCLYVHCAWLNTHWSSPFIHTQLGLT